MSLPHTASTKGSRWLLSISQGFSGVDARAAGDTAASRISGEPTMADGNPLIPLFRSRSFDPATLSRESPTGRNPATHQVPSNATIGRT
jgi:hypothetical protein